MMIWSVIIGESSSDGGGGDIDSHDNQAFIDEDVAQTTSDQQTKETQPKKGL